MISWVWLVILALGYLGYPLLWRVSRRRFRRYESAEEARFQARLTEVFERGTKHLADQVGELRAVLDDERDQKRRFQDKNLEIQEERDQWLKLYHDQSIGHGNAQSIMMGIIDQLGAKLSAAGIKFKVPSVIALMRQEFLQKHEAPSREALEFLKKAEDASKVSSESPPG